MSLSLLRERDRKDPEGTLHTNFRISADGEWLGLVAPDGTTVVSEYGSREGEGSFFPPQTEGVTFGLGTLSDPKQATFLEFGSNCRWLVPEETTDADWHAREFDDASWTAAKTAIGYESNAELAALIGEDGNVRDAMRAVNATIYIRIPFEIVEPAAIKSMALQMQFDDGFAAYLNGELVASENAPDELVWNSQATSSRSGEFETAVESLPIDFQGKLVQGTNILAIQGMNSSAGGSDLMMRPQLTGTIVDLDLPVETGYLQAATPGAPNSALRYTGFAEKVTFDTDRGFFTESFKVTLSTGTPDSVIRYSTDGSNPAMEGTVYSEPVEITKTTVLSAVTTRPGFRPSDVVSHTYVFLDDTILQPKEPEGFPTRWGSRRTDYEMDPDVVGKAYTPEEVKESLLAFPSIAISTDNDNLFDRKIGIYANSQARGDQWERPVSVEFFGFDHGEHLQTTAGLRMQGNASRNPNRIKHNMRIVFRQEYGPAKINFRVFEGTEVETFNSINLRSNNGDSWINPGVRTRGLYIRDQWHREVQRLMHQPNQPQGYAHLYINGLYWGFYHIFERFEAPMLAEHFGGEPEDWDALQDTPTFQPIVIDGDDDAYREAHKLSRSSTDPDTYQELLSYIDVDNLIDYLLMNFYSGNQDWDHKNMRYGRRRTPVEGAIGNGFLFFAWDSERHGLNGLSSQTVSVDVTTKNTSLGPTFLNRNMIKVDEYKLRFADRVHKHLMHGGELTPEGVSRSWNWFGDIVYPGLIAESARWGDVHTSRPEVREGNWQRQMDRENTTWIPRRTDILLNQLDRRKFYDSDALYPEIVPFGGVIEPGAEAKIEVGRLEDGAVFEGTIYYTLNGEDPRLPDGSVNPKAKVYAAETPPTVEFSRRIMSRLLVGGDQWSPLSDAYFHLAALPLPGDLMITEINAAPAPATEAEDQAGAGGPSTFEFVEIENVTDHPIDLSGLEFTRGIDAIIDPASRIVLAPRDVALLVADSDAFQARYGDVASSKIVAEFGGKLSRNGERLTLRDANGEILVTLSYVRSDRWPQLEEPGMSLEFTGEAGDHQENAMLWRLSASPNGSPGETDAAPAGIQAWLATRGLTDAQDTIPVSNLPALLYYALGEDSLTTALADRLPTIISVSPDKATLSYSRRGQAADVRLQFQHSTDLKSWESAEPIQEISVEQVDAVSERVLLEVANPGASHFWRLSVEGR